MPHDINAELLRDLAPALAELATLDGEQFRAGLDDSR
jgi:hypothetical protein